MFTKLLKDEREKMEKALESSSKYYASRADAIDKFNHLPKTSITETKSTSASSAKGGKDGDENKTGASSITEEKISTNDGGKINVHRVKALAALDAQVYNDLVSALQSMIDGYVVILDNLEKNWDKLESPRGKEHHHHHRLWVVTTLVLSVVLIVQTFFCAKAMAGSESVKRTLGRPNLSRNL